MASLAPDGRVLVAGGVDATGLELKSIEIYDPVTNTFTLQSVAMSVSRSGFGGIVLKVP